MPLEAKPLSDEQIATLKSWIDEGAKAPDEKLPNPLKELLEQLGQKKVGE